jgi:hypothetical protein
MSNVRPLPFKGDLIDYLNARCGALPMLWRDGEAYVPVRPICEVLGLDWKSQYRKLTAPETEATMVMMTTVAADKKDREMLCIHIADAMVWLAGLTLSRVKEEARPALKATKLEVRLLIWNYYRDRLLGEHVETSDLLAKMKADALQMKPLRIRVLQLAELGWDFEKIWRAGSASRPKVIETINDLLRLGLMPAAPAGTPKPEPKATPQLSLFAEG